MTLLPFLYALLAALTGLSLGGVAEARPVRPAVAASVAQTVASQIVRAAKRGDPVAAIRPVPTLLRAQPATPLTLAALPIDRTPARRRE